MKITVLSISPQDFASFRQTPVVSRAVRRGKLEFECVDIRDFAEGSFRKIDDSPYGGGPGMVLRVDTVSKAIESVRTKSAKTVLLSPKGKPYDQTKAREYSGLGHLVLVCGHYEGFDERIRSYVDEEISIGDYILTGGEIAAMAVADSVVRLLEGSLRDGSAADESFETGLLEYPHYTHPVEFEGKRVPDVLLSGNLKEIESYRKNQAIIETIKYRPDLLEEPAGKLGAVQEHIGCSDARILVFDRAVLKIQKVSEESQREILAMRWLQGKLPVPQVIFTHEDGGKSYLLMSRVKGRMLCDPLILHNRNRLMKSAAAALKMLWEVDISDCPFREEAGDVKDPVLCHGDFCLPNIFADNSGITGFIDLGSCHIGDKGGDINDCIWSLEANLTGEYSDGSETEPLDKEAFLKLLGSSSGI